MTTTSLTLNTRMMAAILSEDTKAIKSLRDAGVDLAGRNIDGDTWLDVAVERNKKDAAAAILMLGGSKSGMLNDRDSNGNTVLHKAIGVVSDAFIAMLLAAGSGKLNLTRTNNKGVSPLNMLLDLNNKAVNLAIDRILVESNEGLGLAA